ncbi:MAG: hypothetical protein ACK5Z2_14455 [Bacteroidota bacterium]|jgi:hypothetical protein
MESTFIRRNAVLYPGMDFFSLRNEAIAYIQKLAGDEWTDYNEHDPGVTILDQLCYAITDLSYRNSFDAADILTGDKQFSGKNNDTFFEPEEVLHCHALCSNDWRKLIIDKVNNVRNAWVEVTERAPGVLPGLYNIIVEVTQSVKTEEDRKAIEQNVKAVFYNHRNLSEDINSVVVLKHRNIKIKAVIDIDDYINTEETLAALFLKLQEILTRPVRLYTLTQMLEKGYPMDDIFSGPRLTNGYIIDHEMYPRITHIHYARLIRALQEVPGVKHISNFSIEGGDDNTGIFRLGHDESPVLDSKANEQGNYGITLRKSHIPVIIDANIVESIFLIMMLAQPKSYIPGQHAQVLKDFAKRHGRNRNLSFYRSIQYDFPPIYGIGEYGIGSDALSEGFQSSKSGHFGANSEQRRALARQLKGYLHIFEQLLANQLQQLAGIPELFSLNQQTMRTYFPATDLAIPEKEVIECEKHQSEQNQQLREHIAMYKAGLIPAQGISYKEALLLLMKQKDPYYDRRNKILDHLLARFGVTISSSTYEDVNWYFMNDGEFREFILNTKAEILRNIAQLTKERGQSADLLSASAVSTFEQMIILKLGIVNMQNQYQFRVRPLARTVLKYSARTNDFLNDDEWISNTEIKNQKFERYDQLQTSEDYNRYRNRRLITKIKQGQLTPDLRMFHNGYIANNYSIGFERGYTNIYTVVYRDPDWERHDWKRVGRFSTMQDAVDAILDSCAFIRFLNIESEGLHVIEHLALRPDPRNISFETKLKSPTGSLLLSSKLPYSGSRNAQQLGKQITESGCNIVNFSIAPSAVQRGKYALMLTNSGEVIAESPLVFSSESDALKVAESIAAECRYIHSNPNVFGTQVSHHVLHPLGELPPLSFYAFRISVLLPGWSSRFGNESFRSMMGMLLRTNAPAHTGISDYWLSPQRMNEAESLYIKWRKARAAESNETEALAIELARELYRLSLEKQY